MVIHSGYCSNLPGISTSSACRSQYERNKLRSRWTLSIFSPYSWFNHAQMNSVIWLSRYFHDFPMKQMLLQNPLQTLTNKANVNRLDLGLTNNKTCERYCSAFHQMHGEKGIVISRVFRRMNLTYQIENIVCWSVLTALPCPYLSRECVCRTDEIDCRGKGLRKLPADLPQEHNVAKL